MTNLLAQQEIPLGSLRGIGPLGLEGQEEGSASLGVFAQILSTTIGIITIIAGIWFTFLLITGAIGIMSAGSDKGAMENARKRLMGGLIGLVVVIAGIFLIDLIGKIIGLDILNISESFSKIVPQ